MLTTFTLVNLLALSNVAKALPPLAGNRFLPSFKDLTEGINRADSSNSSNPSNSTACATGVHMIIARASTEAPGPGIIGAVATTVQQSVPGSDSEAVDYPATLTDYVASEASGVAAMQKLIENYTARCPTTKIALLGYSQGAQVVGDILCGTSEAGFTATQALSPELSKNIVAVVQMGDPSHVPGLPQDVGTSKKAGVFPRVNTAACGASAAVTQSFCDDNDEFCDSGNSVQVHIGYVQTAGTQASQFIIGKANGNTTTA